GPYETLRCARPWATALAAVQATHGPVTYGRNLPAAVPGTKGLRRGHGRTVNYGKRIRPAPVGLFFVCLTHPANKGVEGFPIDVGLLGRKTVIHGGPLKRSSETLLSVFGLSRLKVRRREIGFELVNPRCRLFTPFPERDIRSRDLPNF